MPRTKLALSSDKFSALNKVSKKAARKANALPSHPVTNKTQAISTQVNAWKRGREYFRNLETGSQPVSVRDPDKGRTEIEKLGQVFNYVSYLLNRGCDPQAIADGCKVTVGSARFAYDGEGVMEALLDAGKDTGTCGHKIRTVFGYESATAELDGFAELVEWSASA